MRNKRLIIALLWTLFVAISCLVSSSTISNVGSVDIPYFDKFVHFCFYTGFTLLWTWSFRIHKTDKNYVYKASLLFLFAVVFGLCIELLQKYTTTSRSFEWLDVVANSSGAFFGLLISALFQKNKPNLTSYK